MARRKKSIRRKKRKPAKAAALPVTLPPFGWNTDDQTANDVVRLYQQRARNQTSANVRQFFSMGNADLQQRRAPETIHAEILAHIDAIEEIIPQLPGIGHNKPPEPIEPPPPLTSDEIAEIKIYVTVMNGLPAEPTQIPTLLGRAWERLKILGEKVLTQLATQATGAAVTVAAATLWREFGDHLTAAGNLIAEWIKVLMHIS